MSQSVDKANRHTNFSDMWFAFRAEMADRWDNLPRWKKALFFVSLAAFFYSLPIIEPPFITTPDTDFSGVLFTIAAYSLVALGLNIVIGYAGLLDLGYVGFYLVGAYVVGMLTAKAAHANYLLAIPVAIIVAMLSGVILGWPTLRVRGDYLAIVTLGFGEILRLTVMNSTWLGGSGGIPRIPGPPDLPESMQFDIPHLDWSTGVPLIDLDDKTTFLKFGVTDATQYYWFALTVIVFVLIADYLIKDSRVGRAWEATREDEDAAELMGVPTFRFKLLAFAMGAFIGGLAGSLFAGRQGFINPQSFSLLLSILFVAAVVVGGQGNRWGVLVGAFVVAYLPERFRGFDEWRVLIFGLALMILTVYRPEGLVPPRRTVRARHELTELSATEEGTTAGVSGGSGQIGGSR